jgi:hypothetical protein
MSCGSDINQKKHQKLENIVECRSYIDLNLAMEHNYAKPNFNAPEKPKINKVLLEMATADLETVQNLEAAFWTLLLKEPMSKRWHTLKTVRFQQCAP